MDKKGVVRTVAGGTCTVYLYDEKRDVSVSIHNVDPGEPIKQDKVTCTSCLTSCLQLTLLVPPSISGDSPTLIAEPFFRFLKFGLLEQDCMNRVRSSLSMRCMLLGDNFEPRPNNHALGTTGSVMTIGLSINGCSHSKKLV